VSGEGADGGEGDDLLLGGAAGSVLRGGTGADRLEGQDGADGLDGGPGDDVLLSGGGANALQGADGDDQLAGGLGADDLRGGPGRDTLSYEDADDGVSVSLDDRPGDGAAGEGDDAHSDVETLVGSAGDDVLRAGAAGATLRGGDGDDRLDGGPGGDVLDGGLADDVLDGDAGADVLAGGDGSDTASYSARIAGVVVDLRAAGPVNGEPGEGDTLVMVENVAAGAGRDRVTGAAGVPNRIDAGDGDDRVLAEDGDTVADDVVCGDGRDAAQLDRQDAWDDESCEAVTASGVVQAPQLTFRGGTSLRMRRSGLARLQLYCDGDTVRWCTGRVGLRTRAGRRAAAHRTFRIGAGLHRHLHVRMTHRVRRRLARGDQPRLRAVIRVEDALGRRATVRFDVRATAARR